MIKGEIDKDDKFGWHFFKQVDNVVWGGSPFDPLGGDWDLSELPLGLVASFFVYPKLFGSFLQKIKEKGISLASEPWQQLWRRQLGQEILSE